MTPKGLDKVREDVLAQMDRQARLSRWAIIGAATLELLMLAAVLLLLDWSDRTHMVLLLLSVLGYSVILLGLVALGAHVSRLIAQLSGALRLDSPKD